VSVKKENNRKTHDICEIKRINVKNVHRILDALTRNTEIQQLADTFSVLSDPTRLKILLALKELELCVCDLADALKLSPSAVSHQLRVLRATRLVKFRRAGKKAFYTLDDDHIVSLLDEASDHIQEKKQR
jgi:ArsR family transcriptional regulator, lead/cadmium/zinc/bismuth-responsive transcriptional repressor